MAFLDLVAVLVLALFVALGAWRGAVAGLVSTGILILGYFAASLSAWRLGPALAEITGQPTLITAPIVGTLAFLAVAVVGGVIGFFIRRWDRRRVEESGRSGLDRTGGALFGFLRGSLIVLLLGILANWLHAAAVFAGRGVEDASSPLQRMTQSVVGGGLDALLGDSPEAAVTARMIARPTESLTSLRKVVEHPRVAALANDRGFWTLVENGAIDSALNHSSFYGILHDTELRHELADVGLVGPGAAGDPSLFRARAGEVLREVGPRVARARNDPAIHALARDPEIAGLLQRKDLLGLLRNRRFSETVERVLGDSSGAG